MLYRVALLSLLSFAAAQDCASAGSPDLFTPACACASGVCGDITSLGSPITRQTTNGPVIGRTMDSRDVFFGIPIGASTAGANRWKAPQPVTPWTTAIQTTVEKPCPWIDGMAAMTGNPPYTGSEDCMAIDIFAPSTASGITGLPIGMFVHGGGFTTQSPTYNIMPNQMKWMDYNFPALPNSGKAINALVHYRLAGLGWMSHPGFVDSSATFMSFPGTNPGAGNYGLMDSINAISWMSQNAVNFGGDPSKITVLGESAGGAHVTMLMASPLTQGLVATFIAESPYITYHSATFSMKARQEMDILYTYRALCTNVIALPAGTAQASSEASCLRAALPLNFVNPSFSASSDSAGVALFETTYGTGATAMWNYNNINCWPVVDGFSLTKPPLEAYASGNNAAATMVVGHNSDEYELFCFNFYNGLPFGNGCTGAPPFMAGNVAWVMALFYLDDSCTLAELYAAYTTAQSSTKFQQLGSGYLYGDITLDNLVASDPTSVTNAKYVQMYNDAWFSSGMTLMTEAMLLAPGRAGSTVYTYLSASQSDPQTYTGAYHGSELTYVLNYYNAGTSFFSAFGVPTAPHTPGQTAVNNAFNGYWTSLYHTANPNVVGVGLPHWDPVTFTSKNTMVFSPDLPYGGAMNPCIRAASCKTEPTKDFRTKQVQFYQGSPASLVYTYMSEPTCTAAPTVFNSHKNVSGDVLTGYTCSFLPCCRYSSTGRRSLLFGMPSTSSSSNCDPMC